MVQLWVNLPADHKMDAPHYQPLTAEQIGLVDLSDNAGTVRVDRRQLRRPHRAGRDLHTDQPVGRRTHRGARSPRVAADHNVAVLAIDGNVTVNSVDLPPASVAVLDRSQADHHRIQRREPRAVGEHSS